MEQETRPGRLMFISRGGSWAGHAQAASPSSGPLLLLAAAPKQSRRDCRSLPALPRRAGASLPPAAGAGARRHRSLPLTMEGGRAEDGQTPPTSKGRRARLCHLSVSLTGKTENGETDGGSPLLSPSRPHTQSHHPADGRMPATHPLPCRAAGRAERLAGRCSPSPGRSSAPAPALCRTDGMCGSTRNNSGEEALHPSTEPSALADAFGCLARSLLLQTFACDCPAGPATAHCLLCLVREGRTKGLSCCFLAAEHSRAFQSSFPGAPVRAGSSWLSLVSTSTCVLELGPWCGRGSAGPPLPSLTAWTVSSRGKFHQLWLAMVADIGEMPRVQETLWVEHPAPCPGPQGLTFTTCCSSSPQTNSKLPRSQPVPEATGQQPPGQCHPHFYHQLPLGPSTSRH